MSLQMEKDIGPETGLDEREVVPELLASTVVGRSLLVKILRRLVYFLDQELETVDRALEFEEKFLEIIQVMKKKNVNQNEFFEEDSTVQDLLKVIFKKILRNITSVKPDALDLDRIYSEKYKVL